MIRKKRNTGNSTDSCRRKMSAIQRVCVFRIFLPKFSHKYLHSAVPTEPIQLKTSPNNHKVEINQETIKHLERLSLVDFANKEGILRLQEAIHFADQIHSVDTTGVEPLISILHEEGHGCPVREDIVTDSDQRELILSNSAVTEDEYFLAPPGNIPLPEKEDRDY